LASEEVRAGPSTLDRAATGVLIHADNFHALQLLSTAYRGTVQCIYIDPPYNAKTSEIPYKNTFKHSAWLSLISSRIAAAQGLLNDGSVFVCAIDENEQEALGVMFAEAYPMHNRTCVSVVHNPRGIQGDAFSYTHEFAYFVFSDSARIGKRSLDEEKSKPLMKTGGESDRFSAKNCFYPILVREGKVIDFGECPEDDDWHPGQAVIKRPDGIEEIWPISVSDRQERKWRYSQTSVKEIKAKLEVRKGRDGLPVIYLAKDEESYRTVWTDALFNAAEYGSTLIKNMFEVEPEFSFPKSLWTVYHSLIAGNVSDGDIALDFFGGSGTTAHAVLALNRTDQSARQFLVVEGARYFSTVLKPRVTKAAFCPDWKDGKAQTLEKGLSSLVKYFALESYEDALNNLPAPSGSLLDGRTTAEKDALIIYALDLELGPRLLDLDAFRDPWGYTIKAQLAGDAEIKRHRVDLVETFNYLIGLKVHAYGPLERYSADFERAAHADSLGRIKIMGRLRRDPNGPFVFQRVEGELNDGNATRVLVVWRKLTDDPEKDAAALDAWMARHRETTRERTEHRDYHLIYINGPVTLPQPTAEIRTVFPTEETFKIKMFEDTDSASSTGGANG
jgi:adenine-specific DNA-methyltransferase